MVNFLLETLATQHGWLEDESFPFVDSFLVVSFREKTKGFGGEDLIKY